MSIPKNKFLIKVTIKATIINIQISQNLKYIWILVMKMIIMHGGLSTRQPDKFTLIKVKCLMMSSLNFVKQIKMCHRIFQTR